MWRGEGLTVRHAEKQPSAQKRPHGERPKWETTRVAAVCKNLQCEGATLRAGNAVLCSVFTAPREYEGCQCSRMPPSTAECVSPRAPVGKQEGG